MAFKMKYKKGAFPFKRDDLLVSKLKGEAVMDVLNEEVKDKEEKEDKDNDNN